jgi:hypothetical protein
MLKSLIWWNLLEKCEPYREAFLYQKAITTYTKGSVNLSEFFSAPHRTAPYRTAPHRTVPHRTVPYRTATDRLSF